METLRAGLTVLKRSMRKVTALAVDLRPAQFEDWDLSNEPAEIVAGKQEAREKLQALLDTARPESVLGKHAERFYILQRHGPRTPGTRWRCSGKLRSRNWWGQNKL